MAESVTRFLGEDASLGKTIQNLEGRLDGFGTAAASVGTATGALPAKFAAVAAGVVAFAAGVAGAIVSIKTFGTALDFIEKLDNLKAATGASAAELVLLQRAFDLTGSSADKVGPAINKVQEMIAKAGEGAPKAVEKLNLLGLSFGELKNLSPAEQMEKVMKAIAAIPDPAERARAAMAIFGTQLGRELLPLIKDFDGEMTKAAATLGSLPRIIETYGPAMSIFSNAIDALKKKPEEFAGGVVGPMSTLLGNLAQRFAEFDASGFGERIGIALNSALVEMLIWSENVTRLLGGVWDGLSALNLGPILGGAFAQISAFVGLAREQVATIYERLRDADYQEIGRRIGSAISYGLEPLKELDTNPAAALNNFYDRLDEQTVQFGANLAKVIADSLRMGVTQARAFDAFLDGEQVKQIGDRIANGIYFAILNFPKWNEAMSSPVNAFKMMWGASQESNTQVLKNALINAFELANSRFLDLFTNPAKLAAGLFGTALRDAFLSFIKVFTDTWTNTNGTIIEKFRAAYNAVLENTGKTMIGATETAATNTKQAGENLATGGKQLEESSARAKDNISQAKAEVTGPGGIAPALDANANALNQTADKTQSASGTIVTAFEGVATSGNTFKTATDGAGQSFAKQADAAGRALESGVRNAMKALTDSVRGFATENTLQRVLGEMQNLNRKLPQPILI
jgi:hypothetical protein